MVGVVGVNCIREWGLFGSEFLESLVSDSKHRVSLLRTCISLGLGIELEDAHSIVVEDENGGEGRVRKLDLGIRTRHRLEHAGTRCGHW